ncbi:hypothetical protein F4781DRAFT_397531 [Annulohypoxylon bovei var. microspora]|nr:hypothetical protein F4781DRAFT_397531 [Annulohypoxylon bovei var. microspora]
MYVILFAPPIQRLYSWSRRVLSFTAPICALLMAPWTLGTLVTFPFEAHENFSSYRGLASAGLAHSWARLPAAPLSLCLA